MTDDQKLVAILLFMVLFAAQLILVALLALILGLFWVTGPMNAPVRGPELLLDFAPAFAGIALAMLCFAWAPFRPSGQWIWLPAALLGAWEMLSGGIFELRTSLGVAVYSPIVACILYSLTIFTMKGMRRRGAG
jgi:hypothetical protein